MDTRRLTSLQASIEALGPNEHGVLLAMLRRAGVECAHNSNGYFCDLSSLADDLVDEIERFVAFCVENNRDLELHDRSMHERLVLLQRVPAAAQPDAAAPPAAQPERRAAPRELIKDAAAKGVKLAFVRRAGDTPCRRRSVDDVIEAVGPPVYLRAAGSRPPA